MLLYRYRATASIVPTTPGRCEVTHDDVGDGQDQRRWSAHRLAVTGVWLAALGLVVGLGQLVVGVVALDQEPPQVTVVNPPPAIAAPPPDRQPANPENEFEDPPNMPGEVIGGTLTQDERAMLELMDPKDRARYLLQKRIDSKADLSSSLSQLQALRHQQAMSVINDIR